jgi:hypothetical protein
MAQLSREGIEIECGTETDCLIETRYPKETISQESAHLVDSSGVAAVLALFAAYSLRIVFAPWLWQGDGLAIFIPVVSPVYRQEEHWQSDKKQVAMIAHVISGAILLILGIFQFDKTLRHRYKWLHRWTGRSYIICGILAIVSLRTLRSSVGAGSASHGHSAALAYFVDTASVLWIIFTAMAVVAALSKRFDIHRDAMAFSLALAAVPIPQRLLSWCFVTPCAMLLRLLVCVFVFNIPPWEARWGVPGSSWSLISSSSDNCAIVLKTKGGAGYNDSRACPLVFTLDGYGEAEQASFAMSAWCGLLLIVCWGLPRLLRYVLPTTNSSDEETVTADAAFLGSADQMQIFTDMLSTLKKTAVRCVNMMVGDSKRYDNSAPVESKDVGWQVMLTVTMLGLAIVFTLVGSLALITIVVSAHALLWIILYIVTAPLYGILLIVKAL